MRDEPQRSLSVRGLADQLELTAALEFARKRHANDRMVVDYEYSFHLRVLFIVDRFAPGATPRGRARGPPPHGGCQTGACPGPVFPKTKSSGRFSAPLDPTQN